MPSVDCGWFGWAGWLGARQRGAGLWLFARSSKRLDIRNLCREVWVYWYGIFAGSVPVIVDATCANNGTHTRYVQQIGSSGCVCMAWDAGNYQYRCYDRIVAPEGHYAAAD